jgi:hypothetical protein
MKLLKQLGFAARVVAIGRRYSTGVSVAIELTVQHPLPDQHVIDVNMRNFKWNFHWIC